MIGFERLPRLSKLVEHVFGQRELVPPGVLLELDRDDWGLPGNTRFFTTGLLTIAGGAGNSKFEIVNLPGSGMIVVVKGWHVNNKIAAGSVRVVAEGAALATPAPCIALDRRVGLAGASRIVETITRQANTGGLSGDVIDQVFVGAGADGFSRVIESRGVILPPGTSCGFQDSPAAEQFTAIGWGYERPALPEELGAV